MNKYFKMKDNDSHKIFESYTRTGDTYAKRLTVLISNWKKENKNWSTLTDDMKVVTFKQWVREILAARTGGNTVQTELPDDDELKEMI